MAPHAAFFLRFAAFLLPLFAWASRSAGSDFQKELVEAAEATKSFRQHAEEMVVEGRLSEANEGLLALFPKETRTVAQTMVLGNLLFGLDAKRSYALHQDAAKLLPNEPAVLLEWAMEQHRAGDYVGALAAYDAYIQAVPRYAPAYGLAADCLIRLGKTKEAVVRWQQSEEAPEGSMETFESMDCDIYKDPTLELRRSNLYQQAQKGDVDSAIQLVALDAKFERDWWNNGPRARYLEADIRVLKKLPPDSRISAALCTAECSVNEEPDPAEIRKSLETHGFLIDPKHTLPSDGQLTSLLIGAALKANIFTRENAREQFGDVLLAAATKTRDPALFNIAAHLDIGAPQMLDLEKTAWEATGDVKFAAGFLVGKLGQRTLDPSDPLLRQAIRQFPEDSLILSVAVAVSEAPSQELLVQAIKAEFRRFSISPGGFSRPSAKPLRADFTKLAKFVFANEPR